MSADDLVGRWVPTPGGGVGQVWAVAGCRAKAMPLIDVIRVRQPPFPTQPGNARCQPWACRCKAAVWVADGRAWHLIEISELQRTTIGATA